MMPSANTPLFYGSNWVVRLGQVWEEATAPRRPLVARSVR